MPTYLLLDPVKSHDLFCEIYKTASIETELIDFIQIVGYYIDIKIWF